METKARTGYDAPVAQNMCKRFAIIFWFRLHAINGVSREKIVSPRFGRKESERLSRAQDDWCRGLLHNRLFQTKSQWRRFENFSTFVINYSLDSLLGLMALDRFGLTMQARDDPSEQVGGRTFDWKSEHKQHMSSRWMDGSFCNHFAGLFATEFHWHSSSRSTTQCNLSSAHLANKTDPISLNVD